MRNKFVTCNILPQERSSLKKYIIHPIILLKSKKKNLENTKYSCLFIKTNIIEVEVKKMQSIILKEMPRRWTTNQKDNDHSYWRRWQDDEQTYKT